MNAVDVTSCGGDACQDGCDHPERILHQHLLLWLSRLDEPQRRWSAAVEATRLGRGGIGRIAAITGLDEQTIRRGQREVAGSPAAGGSGDTAVLTMPVRSTPLDAARPV